ncbi:MAG: preprotein translocase subunit YajC [Bacteroidota bacterium]|jgi:preprotein translocase subunit YajC|uniref:preprotein translocase subunit YajC n=1 Tax=Candidatus Pollutiaquabacter sp. TaxID=3416354 RepID=UPI001A4E282D|nr:preprotein translocase subunit YajC [Bacteroidota bacterium]MBL7947389.1 preprotein translocase subunit YajC [Bacteroidia bacterium]MBP6010201.1 preprotein translocase subunit YajC [Bacteroidia bacterium]MBP7270875.1 preprotein translocase subunit YajC [Bacteroidia bacterium]MBP7437591.1 preprotein translocase subunit YajC [Bacteroidia bacterium]
MNLVLLQSQQNGALMQMLFLVGIIVVFYFFMIRPQMRKQKTEQEFRNSLQKGAKVVTIGGIHGRIVEVADRTFMVEIDNNVRVRVERSAISAEATKALDQPAPAK